jgi:hypothetical protein
MNECKSRTVVLCLIGVSILSLFFLLLVGSATPIGSMAIRFVGVTNSMQGPISVMHLHNDGNVTIRLDPHCTVYWKNLAGVSTNMFARHNLGSAILRAHESNQVVVLSPTDSDVWQTSFTYTVRPERLTRVYHRIRFWLPGPWEPDNSFLGGFGPVITNSTSTATYGCFLNISTNTAIGHEHDQ